MRCQGGNALLRGFANLYHLTAICESLIFLWASVRVRACVRVCVFGAERYCPPPSPQSVCPCDLEHLVYWCLCLLVMLSLFIRQRPSLRRRRCVNKCPNHGRTLTWRCTAACNASLCARRSVLPRQVHVWWARPYRYARHTIPQHFTARVECDGTSWL